MFGTLLNLIMFLKIKNIMEDMQYEEQPVKERKAKKPRSGGGVRKLKELEKCILEQTLLINQAQKYRDDLVAEYNEIAESRASS